MAKQVFKVGTINGGEGDPLYLVLRKLNSNFDEIYTFLTGNGSQPTLGIALPVAQGGTGAITASQARANLGITTTATKDVGTDIGQIVVIGALGFGSVSLPVSAEASETVGTKRKTGEFIHMNDTDRSVLSLGGPQADMNTQLGITLGTKPKLSFRSCPADNYTDWFDVRHTGNTLVSVNGNIKPYTEHAKLTNTAVTSTVPSTRAKTAVGVYTLSGLALATEGNWTVEVPFDIHGNPKLFVEVVAEASGLTIKTYSVKYTNGVAVKNVAQDIPSGTWIDLNVKPI